MSNIEINELKSSGIELFEDSESYLTQLNEDEMTHVMGGGFTVININASNSASYTASFNTIANTAISNSINSNSYGNDNSIQIISTF